MQRAKRKLEHIQYALELATARQQRTLLISASYTTGLPEINPADFVLSVEILGQTSAFAFFH